MLYGWLANDDFPPLPPELHDVLEHYRTGALVGPLAPGEESIVRVVENCQRMRERIRVLEILLCERDADRDAMVGRIRFLVQRVRNLEQRQK